MSGWHQHTQGVKSQIAPRPLLRHDEVVAARLACLLIDASRRPALGRPGRSRARATVAWAAPNRSFEASHSHSLALKHGTRLATNTHSAARCRPDLTPCRGLP
jgi:hypothetical protein